MTSFFSVSIVDSEQVNVSWESVYFENFQGVTPSPFTPLLTAFLFPMHWSVWSWEITQSKFLKRKYLFGNFPYLDSVWLFVDHYPSVFVFSQSTGKYGTENFFLTDFTHILSFPSTCHFIWNTVSVVNFQMQKQPLEVFCN